MPLITTNAMFEAQDHRWIFHHTASRGAEKGRDRSQISSFYLGFVGFIFGYFFLPELVLFNISYTFRVQHEIAVGHILRNTSSETLTI